MIKSYISDKNNIKTRIYDLNLLKHTLSLQSTSSFIVAQNDDKDAIIFIHSVLDNIKIIDKTLMNIESDAYGNIYVTKGKANSYPCIVSHIDTVHKRVENKRIYQQNDILFAFSDVEKKQIGIGGDDLVGVFTCLQSLIDFDTIKVVFFRNEEIGRLGSNFSIKNKKDFYKDCNFILQCDRRGNEDFITNSAGIQMTSKEFDDKVLPYLNTFGFNIYTNGIATDVDVLVREGVGICCANIASGYHNPHSYYETVSVKDVGKAYELIHALISDLGSTKFKYNYEPPKHKINYNNYKHNHKNLNARNNINTNIIMKPSYDNLNGKYEKLPGLWDIVDPLFIETSLKCLKPGCKHNLSIFTQDTSLICHCNANAEIMYMDWTEKIEITNDVDKKQYVYSWYYGAWVEKSNAVFVKIDKLNFWTSKEIYEKEWR